MNQSKKSTKYIRPKVTYTDTLQTYDKIKLQLKDYDKIDDIDMTPLGTFIKYITYRNNKPRLCIGGILFKKEKDYVMIQGSNFILFSVQKYHWKKGADKEIDDPIFGTMFWASKPDNKNVIINEMKTKLLNVHKENNYLKKQNKKLINQLTLIYKDHPEMFG